MNTLPLITLMNKNLLSYFVSENVVVLYLGMLTLPWLCINGISAKEATKPQTKHADGMILPSSSQNTNVVNRFVTRAHCCVHTCSTCPTLIIYTVAMEYGSKFFTKCVLFLYLANLAK